MSFTEDWYSEANQTILRTLAEETNHLEGAVVEVGCWEGRSTCVLANAVHPSSVLAVDHWQGSPGEISSELATQRNVYSQFRYNVETLTAGNVVAYKMGWRDFFQHHPQPIRLLHIDATHTYDEVRDNLLAALPHIVPGGVVCGDDAHHGPVLAAVQEVLGLPKVHATVWWLRRTQWQTPTTS